MKKNNKVSFNDLENKDIFQKFLDANNEELIFHKKENNEPLYKQQSFIETNKIDGLQSLILEDLKKHNYIAIKQFGNINKCQITESFENALLFISDSDISKYEFEFYKDTIKLLCNMQHPLQMPHTPYLFYNLNSHLVYKGISHFNILYRNIQNNNNCQVYINNEICLSHNISLEKKAYEIIILSKKDVLRNKDIFESIIPINKTNYGTSNTILRFQNIKFEKNTILENDSPELKITKIVKNYFYCVLSNKKYIPDSYTKSDAFINFIKEHPALFVRIINNVCYNLFGDFININENS